MPISELDLPDGHLHRCDSERGEGRLSQPHVPRRSVVAGQGQQPRDYRHSHQCNEAQDQPCDNEPGTPVGAEPSDHLDADYRYSGRDDNDALQRGRLHASRLPGLDEEPF